MGTKATTTSICRACMNFCPVDVVTDDGRVVAVTGESTNPLYHGYTCVKGRTQWELYDHPRRLRTSLKRRPDGTFATIRTEDAVAEIGDRLRRILDEFGPRAIALFGGTLLALDSPVNLAMIDAFMAAVGSPMTFTTGTIDQPGKPLAKGLHGAWMAPSQAFSDPDVALLIGNNPLVSHQGRAGNPGDFFKGLAARGGHLIVVDPRRTETAKRATIHLQPRPGEDAAIVAGMIRVIIDEQLHDAEFVAENVAGFEDLRAAVAPFTLTYVSTRAGVDADDLVTAARIFGRAARGYAAAGTGPNMSGHGTLIEYLILCLDTICGHWMRAGELIKNPLTLVAASMQPDKAQAAPPFPSFGYGEKLRVRDLTMTAAGMPTGAFADEILLPGDGQVRAVLSVGGNPAACVPDQLKMCEALRSLDLLVQLDFQMSQTAQIADYVLATTLPFEMPATNMFADFLSAYTVGVGLPEAFAQYSPAIVQPPAGADLIEQWRLLFRLAQRMRLPLKVFPGLGEFSAGEGDRGVELDMTQDPDIDDLFQLVHSDSRIALDEVKRHPKGVFVVDPPVYVKPRDPDWTGRLDVANGHMMADLAAQLAAKDDPAGAEFPFRLTSRRMMHVQNAPTLAMPKNRPRHNPASLHPHDLADLGIEAGAMIEIESARASIIAIAGCDDTLRPGVVSLSHSFGGVPGADEDVRRLGSNPGRLMADDTDYERYSGQPRMSNVPVRIRVIQPVA